MKKILAGLLVFSVVNLLIWHFWRNEFASLHANFQSPDEKYMVRVMEYPSILGHMPGDSGGGSGYVELIDAKTKRVLKRKSTDMVMSIDTVYWETGEVYIKLFASWELPPKYE